MTERRVGESEDATLVRAVAHGSEEALAALYDRHVDGVHAVALRLTSDRQVAEEVVQETFLALWNRAELFDPALASLATWLRTIARNRTVDRLRAAGRRPPLVSLGGSRGRGRARTRRSTGSDRTPSSSAAPSRTRAPRPRPRPATCAPPSASALADMPEPERVVIVLAYREGLTQAEIAERLEWPLGTVKTRTRRALARLRVALEGDHVAGRQPARRAARWMVMEHAEALERIEIAAVEPEGLERLMAGDTPDAAAVAGHLAGCPSCAAELVRIRRTSAVAARSCAPSRTRRCASGRSPSSGGGSRPVGRRRRAASSRVRAAPRCRRRSPCCRPPAGSAAGASPVASPRGRPARRGLALLAARGRGRHRRRRRLRGRRCGRAVATSTASAQRGRDPQRRRRRPPSQIQRAARRAARRARADRRRAGDAAGTLVVLGATAASSSRSPPGSRPRRAERGVRVLGRGRRPAPAPRPHVLGGRRLDLGRTGRGPRRPAARRHVRRLARPAPTAARASRSSPAASRRRSRPGGAPARSSGRRGCHRSGRQRRRGVTVAIGRRLAPCIGGPSPRSRPGRARSARPVLPAPAAARRLAASPRAPRAPRARPAAGSPGSGDARAGRARRRRRRPPGSPDGPRDPRRLGRQLALADLALAAASSRRRPAR